MKPSREEELRQQIKTLAERQKLDSWTEFIEELKVPSEIFPALVTMRPELIRLAPKRELSAEQAEALYRLIAALIETNMALREHASDLANTVQNWVGSIHGLVGVADRIGRFAQFRHDEAAEDEAA